MYNLKCSMRLKYLFLTASVSFGLIYLLFSEIAQRTRIAILDFDVTVRLQDHVPQGFDPLLEIASFLADFEIVIVFLVILVLVLLARQRFFSLLIPPIFLVAHLVEVYGKVFINHPGPPVNFLRDETIKFFPKWHVLSESSYPSGHSLRSVFLAILVGSIILRSSFSNITKGILLILVFSFPFLVIVSRVTLGQHWASDVVGGSLLGASFGFFTLIFL